MCEIYKGSGIGYSGIEFGDGITGRVSCVECVDGMTEEKTKKGHELRERKKSKYLSPPYVDLSRVSIDLPGAGESETDRANGAKREGVSCNSSQCAGSSPVARFRCVIFHGLEADSQGNGDQNQKQKRNKAASMQQAGCDSAAELPDGNKKCLSRKLK
ncbi:hypothetical protein Ancab_017543 [Ancistrocladus abbreviatus]